MFLGLGPYAIAVAGSYAYVANQGNNTLQIVDVSAPAAPLSVGSVGINAAPNSLR